MKRPAHYDLVWLDSVGFYFDEKSGCFYATLKDGRQELSLYDFTIRDVVKRDTDPRVFFGASMSSEDAKVIKRYIDRVYLGLEWQDSILELAK